jgi:hypothetical protein
LTHFAEEFVETRLNELPTSSILRFFLGPDNLGVRVSLLVFFNISPWERSELFNSANGDIVAPFLLSFGF